MFKFRNGHLLGTTMSGAIDAGQALGLDASGNVSAQGSRSLDANGNVGGSDSVTSTDARAMTPEEKLAAEAVLQAAQTGEDAPLGKTPQELQAEAEANTLTPEEQSAADLADATKMIAEDKVPENLKGLPADDIAKFAPFTREFEASGDLSPESQAKAAAAFGVKPQFVKQWVAGLKAQQAASAPKEASQTLDQQVAALPVVERQAYTAKIGAAHAAVGGESNWAPFVEWAKGGGLTAEELTDMGNSVQLSPQAGKRSVSEYYAKFQAQGGANGGPFRDLSRRASSERQEQAPKGFGSRQDQNAALRDPKYGKDPAYTKATDAKIIASNFDAQGFVV